MGRKPPKPISKNMARTSIVKTGARGGATVTQADSQVKSLVEMDLLAGKEPRLPAEKAGLLAEGGNQRKQRKELNMFKINKNRKEEMTDKEVLAQAVEEPIEPLYDPEMDTIDYLRALDKKDYEKLIKKVEIYREADEAVAKLDGKKVVKKTQELLESDFVEA